MWKFSCMCVFLDSDTKNSNQDTRFIFKDQEKELGIGNSDVFFLSYLKKKKDHRVYWIARSLCGVDVAETFQGMTRAYVKGLGQRLSHSRCAKMVAILSNQGFASMDLTLRVVFCTLP